MPIQPTQAELYALNILNNTFKNIESELRKVVEARLAFVKLLETKYHAKLNNQTGELELRLKKKNKKEI